MESGKYIVEAHHGLALARGPLEVAAKGLTSVHVPLNAGFIKVSAKSARTGEPLSGALLTVARKEAADDQGQAVQEPIWVGSGDAEIIVPAGMYDVQLAHGLIKAKQTVTLAAGGRAVSEFTPAMGQLELSASLVEGGPPVPDATFILAEDDPDSPQGRREIARTAHPQPVFAIAAGTYYVTARVGETEVRQRIAVGPGDVVRRSLALGVSRIEVLAALDTGALADGTQLLHRVLTLDGEPREVARSTATPATFSLAAGRYRIESIYGSENVRAATDIDVVAGKDSQIAQHLAAARVTIEPTGGASAPGAALGAWEVRDAKGGVIWRCQRPETKTTLLAPGRYLARIEVADKWLEKSFDLKAGEQRKVDPAQP
jgi:Ca-activated chloride channel family protein